MAEFFLEVLEERFGKAFGFLPELGTPKAKSALGDSFQVDVFEPAREVYKSLMGTPVYDVVEFYDAKGNLLYSFDYPPFMDCSIQKNTNSTIINENGGEVVESFGNQNWSIRLRGILVDMVDHHMPLSALESLFQLFRRNEIIEVTSDYLSSLGISHLYFTDFDPSPVEGFQDTVQFTLSAKSIVPAEFVLFTANS